MPANSKFVWILIDQNFFMRQEIRGLAMHLFVTLFAEVSFVIQAVERSTFFANSNLAFVNLNVETLWINNDFSLNLVH